MSVKRTKRRIDVDMANGGGPEEKQAIRDIFSAQKIRTVLQRLVPLAAQEQNRRKGARKPRRPDIDEWIDKKLERDPDAKSPELWANAPERITDQIGFDRFKKRVTKARQRRK